MKVLRIIIMTCILFPLFLNAGDIKLDDNGNRFSVSEKQELSFSFINHLSEIKTKKIKTNAGNFTKLIIPAYGSNGDLGIPELPVLEQLIRVPSDAVIQVNIIHKSEKLVDLSDHGIELPLFPVQPSISKGEDAINAPFYFDKSSYSQDRFLENSIVQAEVLGNMRGQQLGRLTISPFSYNPVKNQIKVITKLEVEVLFKDVNTVKETKNRRKYYSKEFDNLYKKCINYLPTSLAKDLITTYPVKYVIVSDPMFQAALQPFIEWKTKKGFTVIEAYTNDPNVGNSTSSIHSYLMDLYQNPPPNESPPTYLLIVGDDAQVPSFSGVTGSHLSDMYYCEFDGSGDFYPEMYYGRFSATTSAEVEIQVQKTLMHEKYMFPDPSFLEDVVLVAGVDQSMAPTYGNGQINYGTDYYFNTAHSLIVHSYLYGSGTPITSDMSQASGAIISNISDGCSFANYTAHCGPAGWSDPSFEVSDVSSLQNTDKFGVLIGNCCQSNKFDVSECFGEALLRESNKGAVGYIGGSNNTYWDEDYWWALGNTANFIANPSYADTDLGAYDCLMHEYGEHRNDWFITQGQIIHSGNLAVTQAAGSEQYYWEIYHVMGDPSLMPYIGVPSILNATYNPVLSVGSTSLTVITEPDAYIAISLNGILLDAQYVDTTGVVNLSFPAISNIGNADIVITKQFKQPHLGSIQVISPNGPYVVYSNHTIDDSAGNNNLLVDYSEFIQMNIDLHNVGSANANSLTVTLSTNDVYISLVDSVDVIPLIATSQIIPTINPFTFQVSNNVPDQHTASFNVDIVDNLGNSWSSVLTVNINAPVLSHTLFTIDDLVSGNGNSKLDAGEILDLVVYATNIGNADVTSLTASLSSFSSFITVNNPAGVSITSLNQNQQQGASFSITIDPATPVGTVVNFSFYLTDGMYTYNTSFSEIVGLQDEDYETGNFNQYIWVIDPDFPWTIDSSSVYEGTYSSRSAYGLPDGEESELSVVVDVVAAGDISFFKFVSSEQDYDFLKFKINGTKLAEWSGIDANWSFVSFPVTSLGQTTFKWEYEKDGGTISGDDCAWIDYIVFPPLYTVPSAVKEDIFSLKLSPNPTMGSFYTSLSDNKEHTIQILDSKGKILTKEQKVQSSFSFDISNYPAGTYYLKILPEQIIYPVIKQ